MQLMFIGNISVYESECGLNFHIRVSWEVSRIYIMNIFLKDFMCGGL